MRENDVYLIKSISQPHTTFKGMLNRSQVVGEKAYQANSEEADQTDGSILIRALTVCCSS